jgi:hypothetical protein
LNELSRSENVEALTTKIVIDRYICIDEAIQ